MTMVKLLKKAAPLALTVVPLMIACSSSNGTPPPAPVADAGGDPQTPPMGAANVDAWIALGLYKQWNAEPMVHAARGPSVHTTFNRVFANAVVNRSFVDGGTAEWPPGSALVKEIYAAMGDTTPAGYAVTLKTAATSMGGNNWYFYEKVSGTQYADGMGSATAQSACVNCHGAAGSDAAHTTTPGDHDFVYTPVP
jgi:Cytochrome P460